MDYFEEKPLRPKRPKKKKPFVIECKQSNGYGGMLGRHWTKWKKFGAYATERGARDALKSYERKFTFLKFRMRL